MRQTIVAAVERLLTSGGAAAMTMERVELARWLTRKNATGDLRLPISAERAADLLLSAVIAEPLRQITRGLSEPLPAWDIARASPTPCA